MKINVLSDGTIALSDVYVPIVLKNEATIISVAARDGGFEVSRGEETMSVHAVKGWKKLGEDNAKEAMEEAVRVLSHMKLVSAGRIEREEDMKVANDLEFALLDSSGKELGHVHYEAVKIVFADPK